MVLVRKYDDFASEFLGNIEEMPHCTLLYIVGGSNVFIEVVKLNVFKRKGIETNYVLINWENWEKLITH